MTVCRFKTLHGVHRGTPGTEPPCRSRFSSKPEGIPISPGDDSGADTTRCASFRRYPTASCPPPGNLKMY
ncbi:hypothetical protein DPEC_G00027220 [Dallia pectoralis]|uniref:Uncharacterized protein n=1 Tax=Dallia pectoralis TaxID=75939 RepID=A0ACC2HI60_DALPE|nr:hypothetical protein DPEC_G00027220 [Dallia pectoralis]